MKKVLFILCLGVCFNLYAQTSEEKAGMYMNRQDWFGLQRLFVNQSDSLSPFLHDFGRALLANSFNCSEEACEAINVLLEKYQESMGFDNTSSMIFLLADNLSKLGENAQASEMLKSFCDQLEGKVDTAFLASYRLKEKEYNELSAFQLFQYEEPQGDIIIPFQLDSVGTKGSFALNLQGTLNGQAQQFLLDTGAGVNVVSPEVAKACGMKLLGVDIRAHGIHAGGGQLALADEIKIGSLAIHNVPFYILDMMTGEEKADQYLVNLGAIIGLPLLNKLKEIQLNFVTRQLTIPQIITSLSEPTHNLCYNASSTLLLEVQQGDEPLRMNLDSGSGISHFGFSYYERNKDMIDQIGERDSMGVAGFGGTTRVPTYKVSDACVQLGKSTCCFPQISIVASDNQGMHFSNDGTLGMDFLMTFPIVILNMKDMFMSTIKE